METHEVLVLIIVSWNLVGISVLLGFAIVRLKHVHIIEDTLRVMNERAEAEAQERLRRAEDKQTWRRRASDR